MANVKVVIEEIIKGAGNVSQVAGDLGEVEQASERATSTSQRLSASFTEFNSALSLVNQGLGYAKQFLDATAGETVKYANEVRSLSQVSGASAEQTSRFLQVLDDYKIGTEDALTASRALKNNGLVPTTEAIAKLSDEYLKIQDPAKKLDFIQKNLGRNTSAWTEILGKGSKAIREQSAAIDDNLILSQKQLDAARQLEIAQDSLNDARQGAATVLGNKLIPLETEFFNGINVTLRAMQLQKEEHLSTRDAIAKAANEIGREQQAMLANKAAAVEDAAAVDNLGESNKAAEEAVKKLSDTYNGLLSSMFSIDKQNQDYQKTVDDVAAKDKDLADQKQRLTYEWYQAKQAGRDTIEAYNEYIKKSYELTKAQEDNQASLTNVTEENKKAADQRIFDLVREQVTADGTSTAEFEKLQELAVSKGLVSRAAADQAIAERKAADDIIKGFGDVNLSMDQTIERMLQIRTLGGIVPFGVEFTSNVPAPSGNTFGTNGVNYSQTATQNPYQGTSQTRDNGGWGMPGQTYSIGTGAQPETFTPAVPGYFTPANQQSKNVNINISVGAMNGMQDIDYLAQEIARRVTVA